MSLRLRLRPGTSASDLALADGAALSPDRLAGLAPRVAASLPLDGSAGPVLGDLFDPDDAGSTARDTVTVEGDLGAVERLGAGMSLGGLVVRGHAGPRAGSGMSGGRLAIEGDTGPGAGEGMTGGVLLVGGSAGDRLGAPSPGHTRGLDGGVIVVRGNAGTLAGFRMRRGTMFVGGTTGPSAGVAMIAGTLVLARAPGPGAGALMRRGTIVVLGPFIPGAVFARAGRTWAPYLKPWWDALARAGVPLPADLSSARFGRYSGDLAEGGRGEMLILEDAT